MGKVRDIKDALITLLGTIQYDGETAFADIKDYYIAKFDKYPLAVVLLQNTEANFGSSAQNDRVDTFEIHILISLEDAGKTAEEAQNYVYDLLDLVRDAIDKSQDLDGLVVYMNPTISNSGVIDFGAGEVVDAVVSVQIRYSIEVW